VSSAFRSGSGTQDLTNRNRLQVASTLDIHRCGRRDELKCKKVTWNLPASPISDKGHQGCVGDLVSKSTKPEFSVLPCAEHDDVGMTTRVKTLHPMNLAPDISDCCS